MTDRGRPIRSRGYGFGETGYMGGRNVNADVDDGIISATDSGEFGAWVVWYSKYSQPLLHRIYYHITKKPNPKPKPIKTEQLISNDHISGFLNTRFGLLGYGGFSHLSYNDGGYVVKFYKVNDLWKSKHIIHTKELITDLKEDSDGLGLLLGKYPIWIHYTYVDKKFIKDNLISHNTEEIQNIIIDQIPKNKLICSLCGNLVSSRQDIVQCGPCGSLFCESCWNDHQWCHGKAPSIGIRVGADGKVTGYDGTEHVNRIF